MEEKDNNNTTPELSIPLSVFSTLTQRLVLANKVGTQTYGGDRNVYQALGYPDSNNLTYEEFFARYVRQDIAKAIIDRPVNSTWKGKIAVIENESKETTEFEKSWKELEQNQKLKILFRRLDKLTGLGRYSVLLFGMSDATTQKSFSLPIRKGSKLIYLRPLSEKSAKIHKFEEDMRSPRYGLPKFYEIQIASNSANSSKSITLIVHYSRILHVTEDLLEDEIYGTPKLEAVFNRLIDLEKLVGGDAEMFWRGARPGYIGKVDPDYELTTTMQNDLKDQIAEFENNLRRILVNEGVDYKALEQQIADPLNHVDVQIQMISAVTGIPKRILVGSERGELASSQDKQEWVSYITTRREEQVELTILRPFIDKCIELGILKAPTDSYSIVWDRLFSLTDKEKMEVGKGRAVILKEYSSNVTAQDIVPMESFLKDFLGLDSHQTQEVLENQPNVIREPSPGINPRGSEILKAEENKRLKE